MYPQNIRGYYCVEDFQRSQRVLGFECQHGTALEIIEEGGRKMEFEFGNIDLVVKGVEAGGQVRSSGCSNSRKKP